MKRISFILLPVLVWTALAPFAPFTSTVSAAPGSIFTTVDTAIDGPGHCRNGNPTVNCNIYDGKQYVWLNGGPVASRMGADGTYFFAVLAPGAQHHPNDGGAGNLSDDFDAYTSRTFTIAKGKVSGYTGSHAYHRSHIRLFSFADTPNRGGVYILAICSLSKGYPVKPSNCKYDQFKVRASTPVLCAPGPGDQWVDFSHASIVVGLGTVATGLDIESAHPPETVHVKSAVIPKVFRAGPDDIINGGIGLDPAGLHSNYDGFGDVRAGNPGHETQPHFTFTFPNMTVCYFSVRMLDFGDFNPQETARHTVTMTAYDAVTGGNVVDTQTLDYTTTDSSRYPSDMAESGDAINAVAGQPGNWTWQMRGQGIRRIEMNFVEGWDPDIGFDLLHFAHP